MAAAAAGPGRSETTFRSLDARISRLEGEVQRVHDEVEACSVLVLTLDAANGSGGGAGGASGGGSAGERSCSPVRRTVTQEDEIAAVDAARAESARLNARLEVIEEAWAHRAEAVSKGFEDQLGSIEREISDLYRMVRLQENAHMPAVKDLAQEVRAGLAHLRDQVDDVRNEMLHNPANDPKAIETLVEGMITEVGKSCQNLEERCARLEDGVARCEAIEVGAHVDRQRAADLERMVESLVQRRREDILATNNQLREIDSRIKDVIVNEERNFNWHTEAEALHHQIDDLKTIKLPAIAHQSQLASRLIGEGLQALRAEVQAVAVKADAVQNSHDVGGAVRANLDLASVRAEVEVLREQVHTNTGGLEDRLVDLRADCSREVESAVREVRQSWADCSRRLASLEPWQKESALMIAEVKQLRLDRQEDRGRIALMMQDEMLSLRAGIAEGLEKRLASIRRDVGIPPPRGGQYGAEAQGQLSGADGDNAANDVYSYNQSGEGRVAGVSRLAGSGGPPTVLGRRVEWALSAAELRAARRQSKDPLVTGELEVAGVQCRLKFYPDGSPLKQREGSCSLYLLALAPIAVRFHLFAGNTISPLMECTYERRRDQGRHDLCRLVDVLDPEGGIVVGAEILDTKKLDAISRRG